MATSIQKKCAICDSIITDFRSYRSLGTEASRIYSSTLKELGLDSCGYACKFCVNKLNRITRLDEEIRTKVNKLKETRVDIIKQLSSTLKQDNVHVQKGTPVKTPVKTDKKRDRKTVFLSPTPRKFKARRILPYSSPAAKKKLDNFEQKIYVDNFTQTKRKDEKDFDVKVNKIMIIDDGTTISNTDDYRLGLI